MKSLAASQRDSGSSPTVSSVPPPLKCSASKRRSLSDCARAFSVDDVLPPRRDRVGLVETYGVEDLAPETLGVRLAVELGRPAVRRARGDAARPVRLVAQTAQKLRRLVGLGLADARRVEAAEELRIRVAQQLDVGDSPVGPVLQPREVVRRRPRDRVVRRVLCERLAPVVVAVDVLHVAGARAPRRVDQRAHERGVLDPAHDDDVLPVLHVRPDADDQVRVGVELLLRRHRAEPTARPQGTVTLLA